MAQIALLVRFDGGPSGDGRSVIVRGQLADNSRVQFSIEPDKVSWVIAKLMEWTREAASRAGWTAQPISQQDDTIIEIRPSQCGLVRVEGSEHVHLAIDAGPVRLRIALTKSSAVELGLALQAAAASEDRAH